MIRGSIAALEKWYKNVESQVGSSALNLAPQFPYYFFYINGLPFFLA